MPWQPAPESSLDVDLKGSRKSWPLNEGQAKAVELMSDFLQYGNDENEFVLKGGGGVGKTHTMPPLLALARGEIVFTAPTNKATKVLRNALRSAGYTPPCRTIFSLLGLRIEANGEIRQLSAPEDPVDLGKLTGVVVDECSMENLQLRSIIRSHARQGIKFIHMGDWAQLNPVGEDLSEVWKVQDQFELTKVERNGGAILELVNRVRSEIPKALPTIRIDSDNDDETG